MTPPLFIRALAGVALVSSALGGCQSDVERQVALVGLSSSCRINSDCAELLLCVFERCHEQCETSRDCPRGARCVTTEQGRNVCQLPEDAACSGSRPCQGSQVCGADAQCRDGCRSDAECVAEQVCSAATCADPSELTDEGVLPPSPADPPPYLPCAFDSDCPGALACRAGACRVECNLDTDCGGGERCSEGSCAPAPPPAGSCLRSSDCAQGASCVAGWCTDDGAGPEPACAYDSDCDIFGQRCVDGACRCECETDAECAAGFACQDACRCEPATRLVGDVSVSNDRELAAIRHVVEISGQLSVQINRQGTFHVPNLRKAGSILVGNPGGGFVFDSLEEVSGAINCHEDCSMPALRTSGDISFTSSRLRRFDFPLLEKAGNLYLFNNSRVTSVSLPELTAAQDVQFVGNISLADLSAPKLQSLTSLLIQNNEVLRQVSLPLAAPSVKVELSATPRLEIFELPRAESLSGWLTISSCERLGHVRLPALGFVQQLQVDRLPKLVELELSSLREAPGGAQLVELGTAPGFPLSLPALESAGSFIVASGHPSGLSAPQLTRLDSLGLTALPSLAALDLRRLKQVGSLEVSGTQLPDLLTLIKPPAGLGALESAATVSVTNNPSLPVCAVIALESSLGAGLTGILTEYGSLECPCNGASCQ